MLINPAQVGSPLLAKQRMSVEIEGELVALTIGNAVIRMPYETALQLSQWLRVRGKEAKRLAGDQSRHWSAVAVVDGLKA
jgi:hypothetical protein